MRKLRRLAISGFGVALGSAGPGFGGLDFAIAWGTRVVQFVDEAGRSRGNLLDGAIEGRLIRARRAGGATQFADELDGGRADLVVSGWRFEVGECFDGSAHTTRTP
jgi:hypothetical protein